MENNKTFRPPEDTIKIIARVPQEELVFVDMIFKSYEGIAMLTLDEGGDGIIKLDVTPGTYDLVMDVLNDLNKKFSVEIIKDKMND